MVPSGQKEPVLIHVHVTSVSVGRKIQREGSFGASTKTLLKLLETLKICLHIFDKEENGKGFHIIRLLNQSLKATTQFKFLNDCEKFITVAP